MTGLIGAIWGIGGIVLVLVVAVYRLAPRAAQAFAYDFEWYHWAALVFSLVFTAYTEGYRGFQKSFSPRTAARARYLRDHPTLLRVAAAPLFCVGYFDATRRRKIGAWGLTLGIVLLVALVRLLPQPWRGIVDAGVVIGLTWGAVSLIVCGLRALTTPEFAVAPEVKTDAIEASSVSL
jgi:hypothetical protein